MNYDGDIFCTYWEKMETSIFFYILDEYLHNRLEESWKDRH